MRMTEEALRTTGDRGRQFARRGLEVDGRSAVLLRDRLISAQVMGEGERPLRPDLTCDLRNASRGDAGFCDLQGFLEVAPANQERVELTKKPNLVVPAARRPSEL